MSFKARLNVQFIVMGLLMILVICFELKQIYNNQSQVTNALSVDPKQQHALKFYSIGQYRLFGLAKSPFDSYPVVEMPYYVIGVLAEKDAQHALAIIEGPDGTTKIYGVGESLPGGAIIQQVIADGILLRSQGQIVKLPLKLLSEDNI